MSLKRKKQLVKLRKCKELNKENTKKMTWPSKLKYFNVVRKWQTQGCTTVLTYKNRISRKRTKIEGFIAPFFKVKFFYNNIFKSEAFLW